MNEEEVAEILTVPAKEGRKREREREESLKTSH